jgi:hypothetical protein
LNLCGSWRPSLFTCPYDCETLAGTRGGYDDLRRAATRERIGKGLRPSVASIGDLARMLAALGREQDLPPLQQLRTLAELERSLVRGIER